MILNKSTKFFNRHFINHLKRSVHKLSAAGDSEIQVLHKQDPQVTQSSSGVSVVSIENYSPISNVSVIIKAGSRYENKDNLGLVHCLRTCAVLSTKNASSFIITRNLEMIGAKLGVTASRENLVYSLQVGRDNLETGLEILTDVVFNPAFKPWEVQDISPRQHLDLALLKTQPGSLLLETLHKISFRGGLSHSLYSEDFMVGKYSVDMLKEYVNRNFTTCRSTVMGLGVPHDDLQKNINQLFSNVSSSAGEDSPSKFSAGEIRLEADYPQVHTAIVVEGASLTNHKEVLSLGVLQCIMGLGPHIHLSDSNFSKLGLAGAKCTSNPFAVSAINLNYSDTGLFGIYLVGQPTDMKQLVKAIMAEMRSIPKCINDGTVKVAKHKLKAKLLLERDSLAGLLQSVASEVQLTRKLRSTAELEQTIDTLTTSDVSAIASKILKTKPAMASLGRLHSTPFLDELL